MPAFIDLTGKTFNYLTAIKQAKNRSSVVFWLWRCICGAENEASGYSVTSGLRKSCGCKSPNKFIDLTGMRFGLWSVVRRNTGKMRYSAGRTHREYWICRCDCGTERSVSAGNMKNGSSRSCGCVDTSGDNSPIRRKLRKKYGDDFIGKDSPWYGQASGIQSRCRAKGLEFGFGSIWELAAYLAEIAPDKCPVLGVPFERGVAGFSPYAPSVDRKENSKGYVRGNIEIMSMRANSMKYSANDDELMKFAEWITARHCALPAGWSAGLL